MLSDGSIRWISELFPAVTGTQVTHLPFLLPNTSEAGLVYKHPFIKKIIEPKSIGGGRKRGVFVHTCVGLMIDEGAINQESV